MSRRIPGSTRGLFAAFCALGLFAVPASADPDDFAGNWHNVDPNTPSIARVEIHPSIYGAEVHAFGACQPQACDWGSAQGHFPNPDTLEAKFTTGFSEIWLTLHRAWHHRLDFRTHTHFFNPGRPDYDTTGELERWGGGPGWGSGGPGPGGPGWGPGGPGGGPGGPGWGPGGASLGPEDCIGFDPSQVQAAFVGGDWKVVQGSMWMLDYGGNQGAANRAANVIHHTISRSNAS